MGDKTLYFELISAQRYFHLVGFKVNMGETYSLADFWENCGMEKMGNGLTSQDFPKFSIEHSKVVTSLALYGVEKSKDFSLNNDGAPPFKYDLFVINLKEPGIFIFGFPFKAFAKATLANLIKKQLLKKGEFLTCDLNKLIKLNENEVIADDFFLSRFSGLELLVNDKKVNTVILDGDNPLESQLYKEYFEQKVLADKCMLEKCSLKCSTITGSPITRSNVHIDLNGNYKLYVHGSGNNIFTIPYLFLGLDSLGCFETTITNPITKLEDEQI